MNITSFEGMIRILDRERVVKYDGKVLSFEIDLGEVHALVSVLEGLKRKDAEEAPTPTAAPVKEHVVEAPKKAKATSTPKIAPAPKPEPEPEPDQFPDIDQPYAEEGSAGASFNPTLLTEDDIERVTGFNTMRKVIDYLMERFGALTVEQLYSACIFMCDEEKTGMSPPPLIERLVSSDTLQQRLKTALDNRV